MFVSFKGISLQSLSAVLGECLMCRNTLPSVSKDFQVKLEVEVLCLSRPSGSMSVKDEEV